MTRETVAVETPARLATSVTVALRGPSAAVLCRRIRLTPW
jgi:hypothetical protein